MSDHLIVIGASGRRAACRVCREPMEMHDFQPNPRWGPVCTPTPEALSCFEKVERERIAEALANLEHAAKKRLEMTVVPEVA